MGSEMCIRDSFYPGDLGFINEKGRLVLAGRVDELLNLGGVKANPEILEEIALTVDGVLEAAAFSIQTSATEELSFALVTSGGFDLSKLEKKVLAKTGFKVSSVRLVSHLPRNPAGKIERFKLRGV